MKLNLGCGSLKLKEYENIDIAEGRPAYPLDYIEDGSCDEIRASHILEHFGHEQTLVVLSEWVKKLKVGGMLKIAVPDFKKIAKGYLDGSDTTVQQHIMGGHCDENDYHKAIFDYNSLKDLLERSGLDDIQEWQDYHDTCSLGISLNLCGVKKETVEDVKIKAVISMPRLAFTDNLFTAHRSFIPLGIDLEKGTGAFWGQVLTNMLEKSLDCDYVITMDYDSFFTREHVIRLCQLMQENPDIDAIVPLEAKRESDDKLFGATTEQSESDGSLMPIVTGHFGLTIFRCSALRKMSKPWIWGQPNSDGEWGEGRLDPDIYFWQKFHKEGFKAVLAKDIKIIHLQMMGTYLNDNGETIHCYMNDLNAGVYPDGFKPDMEMLK